MPLTTLLDNEYEIMKQMGATPSEQASWPYWKFEYFIDKLNKDNEAEAKRQREQEQAQAQQHGNMPSMNPGAMASKAQSMLRR
jgi:hypothetical protein